MVSCILAMKNLGHRAYMNVDEQQVRDKAKQLPVDGVPPELITLPPNDGTLDKVHVQKAATPVEGLKSDPSKAFSSNIPNAAVLERSGAEQCDIQLRRGAALRTLVQKPTGTETQTQASTGADERAVQANEHRALARLLQALRREYTLQLAATFLDGSSLHSFACACKSAGHCYAGGSEPADHAPSLRQKLKTAMEGDTTAHRFVMTSGTGMMPQFRPWYFGVAFAFLFSYFSPRQRKAGIL